MVAVLRVVYPKPEVDSARGSPYSGILRVWQIDGVEGGKGARAAFLSRAAKIFEEENEGVFVLVTAHTKESAQNAVENGDVPDVLSFSGACDFAADIAVPLSGMEWSASQIGGKTLAYPWCRGGYFLFSPYEKDDRSFCAAVATAFHTFMPEYQRSKNLYALVLGAIQAERAEKNAYDIQKMVDNAEAGFLDIQLPDVNGQLQALSSLKGNVFLLDFSAAEMPNNTAYIFELRDLYNRYHDKGFQIYQVSADRSLLLWQDAVKALPWICVRGEQGVNEECFRLYNISQIPTNFLFGKDGVIIAKNIPFGDMPSYIEKQLRK